MALKKSIFVVLIALFSLNAEPTKILNPQDYPDPFSPNSDSIKDECRISFVSSKYYSKWNIIVISQTNIIREFTGVITNGFKEVEIIWDGKDSTGGELSDGVYKYKIELLSDILPPETTISAIPLIYNDGVNNYAGLFTEYSLFSEDYGLYISGLDYILYRTDSSTNWSRFEQLIKFENEGEHNIFYKAIDKAGNIETEKTIRILVDCSIRNNDRNR